MVGLTHSIGAIQPSFTTSKRNMGEIYGLKFHLSYVHEHHIFFKSLHAPKKGHFVTVFIISANFAHGGISKYFFLDHFSPSFLGQIY